MCLQTASSLEDLYCIHIDILKFTNIRVSKRIQRSNKHCLILWFQVNLAQQKTSIYISKWCSRKQLHLSIKSISWIQQYGTTTDNFIPIDIMLSKKAWLRSRQAGADYADERAHASLVLGRGPCPVIVTFLLFNTLLH